MPAKKKTVKGRRTWRGFCSARDRLGIQCERERHATGRHAYDLAAGGSHQWTGGLVPARTKRPMLGLELTGSLEQQIVNTVTALLRVVRGPRISREKDRAERRGQKLLATFGRRSVR